MTNDADINELENYIDRLVKDLIHKGLESYDQLYILAGAMIKVSTDSADTLEEFRSYLWQMSDKWEILRDP